MKRYLFLLLLAAATLPVGSNAQQTMNGTYKKTLTTDDTLHMVEEYLVGLAMKGPRYEVSDHQNKVNEYTLKAAQSTWLNVLAVSYNINDQTFSKQASVGNANIYPKYTFGVTLPMGIIFSHTQAKQAREQIKMGKNAQEVLARQIRKEVIIKYLQYRTQTQIIATLTHTIDDEAAAYKQVEDNFKNGVITFEQYNASSKGYNADLTQRLQQLVIQQQYKLELEEMIGVPLEAALVDALAVKPDADQH